MTGVLAHPAGTRYASARSGLTLVEVAVVLVVTFGVLSAIWVGAATVWTNYRVDAVQKQMLSIVKGVQSAYASRPRSVAPFNTAADTNITAQLDTQGFIPVEMRANPAVVGAGFYYHTISSFSDVSWGSFRMLNRPAPALGGGAYDYFRIEMRGLDVAACIKLVMALPLDMPEVGAVRLIVNANTVDIDTTDVDAPGGATPIPVPNATAQVWCNAGANNSVAVDFKVRV